VSEIDKVMPTLVLEAKGIAGDDVAARVTMDGELLTEKLDGTAIPVDPGQHRFTIVADGLKPAARTLIIQEGEKDRREQVVLGTQAQGGDATSPETGPPGVDSGATQRLIGLGTGGVGLAGLVVGSIFGLTSGSTWNHALSQCVGMDPRNCPPKAVQEGSAAGSQATVSTVAFGLGAAALAAGAILYFTAPASPRLSGGLAIAPGAAALGVRGAW
jgi:hypothetical protein